MKNRFIAPLFIVILTLFGLVSCSDGLNDNRSQGQVSMTFPVRELYSAISAREATDSTIKIELNVKLYVNNEFSEETTVEVSDKFEEKEVVFKKIPYNSTVYATATVTSKIVEEGRTQSSIMMTGESNKITVTSKSKSLEIQLKWYDDSTVTDPCDLYLEFYVKDSLDSDEYELYQSYKTGVVIDYNELMEDPQLLSDNTDFMAIFLWQEFDLTNNGYEPIDEADPDYDDIYNTEMASELEKEEKALYLKLYYVKTKAPAQTKTLVGKAGDDQYLLSLYNNETYEICDSINDRKAIGSWMKINDSSYAFTEYIYMSKNRKPGMSPTVYKDGKLIEDLDEMVFDLVSWTSDTKSITITYYNENGSLPITFTVPEKFDIGEFGGGDDDDNTSLSSTFIISGQPKFTISQEYSEDVLYLNTGNVSFTTSIDNEEFEWSCKLYYGGKEVSPETYSAYTEGEKYIFTPVALPNGGTYILHITAALEKYATVVSNYTISVEALCKAEYNIDDEDFFEKLLNFFKNAGGPVKLVLTGSGRVTEYNKDANIYNFVSYTLKTYDQNDVELDMSQINSVNATYIDLRDFTGTSVTKLILPPNVKAINYSPDIDLDISESQGPYTTATWYAVNNVDTRTWNEVIEAIFTGTKVLDETTRNELEKRYANYYEIDSITNEGTKYTESSWESIVQWIDNNYRFDAYNWAKYQYLYVMGE